MRIVITADGRKASATTAGQPLTSGSVGIEATFELSADYDGLAVTAAFRAGEQSVDVLLPLSGRCVVPWEVLETAGHMLMIGVVGKDGSGNIVIPTVWARVGMIECGTEVSGIDPQDPTPDIAAQLLQIAQDTVVRAETAETNATEAATAAAESKGDAETAAQAAETAKAAAEEAAPCYAVYGVTTKAQIESAINNKRQIYLLTAPLVESTPQAYVMPLAGQFEYRYTDEDRIVISRGYRFSITSGTNQYIAELANGWTVHTNDLSIPAQRAEAAAAAAASSATAAANSATAAGNAKTAAETAQGAAEDAQEAAEQAQCDAEAARQAIEDLGVDAHTDYQGPSVTKTVDPETGAVTLDFGIPEAPVQSVNGKTGAVQLDLDDIPDGEGYARTTPAQVQQIGTNAADIAQLKTDVAKKYEKPASGIPKTDLASGVQESLGKADTALQPAALEPYRTAAAQDVIDAAQDDRINENANDIDAIEAKIPAEAGAQNQLADKAFVNSALVPYRTAEAQDEIDTAQDERIDAAAQATSSTTVGPASIVTFDASTADMPLKSLLVSIEPVQAGSGDPSPENVRPISGWTGCNILRYAESLVAASQFEQGRLQSTGAFSSASTNRCATRAYIPVLPNTQYTIATNVGIQCIAVHYYTADSTWIYRDATTGQISNVTTPANCNYARLMVAKDNTDDDIVPAEITTAIMAVAPMTTAVSFPASAGTVYGGTLTINADGSVELMATQAIAILNGSEPGWQMQGTYQYGFFLDNAMPGLGRPTSINSNQFKCNKYTIANAIQNSSQIADAPDNAIFNQNNISTWLTRLWIKDTAHTGDLAGFKTSLAENNLQIVYPLAEPITYQLTPQEITTLLGVNNVWANTGYVTVTYGAYLETIKASLDRTNGELANLRACIAPIEDGDTASQAYAAGAFFFRGGQFCTALTAISSGAAFTLGTNYQVTTVAAALIALQS